MVYCTCTQERQVRVDNDGSLICCDCDLLSNGDDAIPCTVCGNDSWDRFPELKFCKECLDESLSGHGKLDKSNWHVIVDSNGLRYPNPDN